MKFYHALACAALGVCASGLWIQPVQAQVLSTFDTDEEGWYVEGDGNVSWNAGIGLPAGSMQTNDDATGDRNIAVAPTKFHGDWSMATASDSIAVDHRYEFLSGALIPNRPYFFELSGPGGRAQAFTPLVSPPPLTWTHFAVSLDAASWTMVWGDWNALLDNVTGLRMMAEYVDGDERNQFDNVRLDITPVPQVQDAFQCTDFETGSFEGWTFEGTNGTVSPGQGNPGTGIRLSDVLGPASRGIAPNAFWGDWTALDGSGLIGYDVRIASGTNVGANAGNNAIIISGPGGEARLNVPKSVIDSAVGGWSRVESVIDSANWTVTSGSWDSLLQNVNRINIRLEFINGSEQVYFDNFCLGNPCTATPAGLTDSVNSTGAYLSWDSQKNQGAIGYRVGGKPEGAGGFSFRKVVEPNTSFFVPQSRLMPDTTYLWVVEAVCTPDGSLRTDRAMDSFATPAAPALRQLDYISRVFPNPTTGLLRIQHPGWSAMVLYDGQGRRVRRMPAGTKALDLDLSGLAGGVYWLKLQSLEGRTELHPIQLQ